MFILMVTNVPCTDRHGTYFNLGMPTHRFCLVHLTRNLQFLSYINKSQQWSRDMQQPFRDAMHEMNKAEAPPGIEVGKTFEERHGELLDEDVATSGKTSDNYGTASSSAETASSHPSTMRVFPTTTKQARPPSGY